MNKKMIQEWTIPREFTSKSPGTPLADGEQPYLHRIYNSPTCSLT